MKNVKYTENQLKTTIIHELVGNVQVHYSICKKEAMTLSFMKNDRLLYLDETSGILFYINQINSVPFTQQKNLPMPKGDVCYISLAVIKSIPKTSTLSIQFNKKVQKKSPVAIQWNFTFQSVALSKQWIQLIRDVKNKKMAKALGLDEKNKDSVGVINDTLAFGMLSKEKGKDDVSEKQENNDKEKKDEQKKTQPKKQDPPANQTWNDNIFKPTTSKYEKPKKEEEKKPTDDPNKSSVGNSQVSKNEDPKKSSYKPVGSTSKNESPNKSGASSPQKNELKPTESAIKPVGNSTVNKNQSKPTGSILKNDPSKPKPASSSSYKPASTVSNKNNDKNVSMNKSSFLNAGKTSPMASSNVGRPQNKPPPPKSTDSSDWNKRFLLNYDERTILDFKKYSKRIFHDLTDDDLPKNSKQLKQVCRNGLILRICHFNNPQAFHLKNQHKNYHFILAITQDNPVIRVPLTCIISYMGLICLVKADLPQDKCPIEDIREINGFLKKLQVHTKISNSIWRKNGKFWDLAQLYGKQAKIEGPIIYVDCLVDYIPIFNEQLNSIRTELFIMEEINSPLEFWSPLTSDLIALKREQTEAMVAAVLSDQQVVIANYNGLKSFLHAMGINMSSLPKIYQLLQSRQSKKIIHTALIAKIIHKQFLKEYASMESKDWKNSCYLTQQLLKCYFEKDSEDGQQMWQKVALELKKKYRIALNPHEIEGGFLLSSVILMLKLEIDASRINKEKQIILDSGIFSPGFILQVKTKTKIHHKFRTHPIQKCLKLAGSQENVMEEIIQNMRMDDDETPGDKILSTHMKMQFYSQMSKHISFLSKEKKVQKLKNTIYQLVNKQPVSVFSHQITMQYLCDCLKDNNVNQYKAKINIALDILVFWCGEDHMYVCDIYQSLSDFYALQQAHQDSINFMKQALTTCVRAGGTHTKRAGIKYYQLASKQLMFGFKNEALQNLLKAKSNMEIFEEKADEYPLVLNKLASLYLNKGDLDNCVALTVKALQESQNSSVDDAILIKNYLLLCRAYEIKGEKAELQNLGHLCAKVFNNTADLYTFDQMIRICVTVSILTMPPSKKQKLAQFMKENKPQENSPQKDLEELMKKSRSCLVMQKFMSRITQADRAIIERKNGRESNDGKQIRWFLQRVFGVVGEEFVEGILAQAQYFA